MADFILKYKVGTMGYKQLENCPTLDLAKAYLQYNKQYKFAGMANPITFKITKKEYIESDIYLE